MYMLLANNNFASKLCAISESAFLSLLSPIYIARIFATGVFRNLNWFKLVLLISDHFIKINIELKNL